MDGSAGTPAIVGSNANTGLVFASGQVSASLSGTSANVPLVQGTAQNTTSGTAIDFTGIPSWAKRITVSFQGVSTNGTSAVIVQLGTSGGVVTSGYLGMCTTANAGSQTAYSSGFIWNNVVAATDIGHGTMTLTNLSGNNWVETGLFCGSNATNARYGAGSIALAGALTQVRLTTANGTDAFDAGSVNLLWE